MNVLAKAWLRMTAGASPRAVVARRDSVAPCRSAREFGDIFRAEVAKGSRGFEWKRDLRPWLGSMIGDVEFGDPDYDWSPDGARLLAREFLSEASTW